MMDMTNSTATSLVASSTLFFAFGGFANISNMAQYHIRVNNVNQFGKFEFQSNSSYDINSLEILIKNFFVSAADRRIVPELLTEGIGSDLFKLSGLIKNVFGNTGVDLTYCIDNNKKILLVNIHGTDNPYLDIKKMDRLNTEWYKVASFETINNLLLDVID